MHFTSPPRGWRGLTVGEVGEAGADRIHRGGDAGVDVGDVRCYRHRGAIHLENSVSLHHDAGRGGGQGGGHRAIGSTTSPHLTEGEIK